MPTKIEWAQESWNPVTGCTKVSAGCKNCYAERMSKRLAGMGQKKYADGFEVRMHASELERPLRWKKPRRIFVCSMSDLFNHKVPYQFANDVVDVARRAPQHTFIFLTKRSDRLRLVPSWPINCWVGVSAENQECYDARIHHLARVKAKVRWVSCEPLLGPIDLGKLGRTKLDWVVVGGESGPGARPPYVPWVTWLRDQCVPAGISFFFKQWGGPNKKATGRLLHGREWMQWPDSYGTLEAPK